MRAPDQTSTPAGLEPGSFRDPESRVFYSGDEVYRALSTDGLSDYDALEATGLLQDPRVVGTRRAEDTAALRGLLVHEPAGVLRHERIPFVSYPYEWTFSMLKDAALVQLDLLLAALEKGLVLKDSTPYNVQYVGASPRFVDIGSFERLRDGEPWVGYRQFCMLYLYPLLLQAAKGVPFHPWLRGSIDGITPPQMRSLMSFRDRFRRGLFTNVFLHAKLERRYADKPAEVKREVKKAGFNKEILVANVRKMRKLVSRLEWDPPEGVWTAYGERNSYTDDDARRKDEFVREVATSQHWKLVWDVGANNGRYSRIAAEGADTVVAVDADQGPVELLYRDLREEGDEKILTLAMNLADPSPGLGWRGLERRSMPDRGTPDLVLALAVIHHVAMSANVPVKEFVDWLASLGASLVIEFPTREDPMVKTLLAPKRDGLHPDYELDFFERCLHEAFDVQRSERLQSGTRVLYFARPKS
ncbi:MAG: class I SAM-dependent methyltransferase [Thermoleophilaceae bacterium]|nr:class I SAM-dependent methyltransferase [Thermoleophilaceae bacterium]